MSDNVSVFESRDFGSIRTLEEDNKVLFRGSDVAKALGYKRANDAVSAHCKGTVKRRAPTKGGEQKLLFIPEGDVYRLIAHSKLPSAEKFERWVFDEVLPTIRKHSAYMTGETLERALTNPDFLIQLATKLKEEQTLRLQAEAKVAEQNDQLVAQKPMVTFANSVKASDTSILVGELAKLLKQNGCATGERRLYATLRNEGFLIRRKGTDWNMPTQKAMEMNLFEINESTFSRNGMTFIKKTPKVTGKGQIFFINRYCKIT